MEVIKNDSVAEIIELDVQSLCRLCGSMNVNLLPIFDQTNSNDIPSKIVDYLGFSVDANDPLPHHVCIHCTISLLTWHSFYQSCSKTNIKFQQMLVNDSVEQKIDFSQNEAVQLLEEEEFCQELEEPEKDLIDQENIEYFNQEEEEMPENHDMPVEEDQVLDNEEDLLVTKDDLPIESEPEPENNEEEKKTRTKRKLPRYEDSQCSEDEDEKYESDFDKEKDLSMSSEANNILDSNASTSFANKSKEWYSGLFVRRNGYYHCPFCKNKESKKSSFIDHMVNDHNYDKKFIHEIQTGIQIDYDLLERVKVTDGANGNISYKCPECQKLIKSAYTFSWHMLIHTGEKLFQCSLCDKSFRIYHGLARHLKETHDQVKDEECDICFRKFANRRNLTEHRYIHTGERNYKCDICGKRFTQSASLFVHKRSHQTTFPFHCTHCSKGFRSKAHLEKHITVHTGEKRFECDICFKRFSVKYDMTKHRSVHTEDKPFECTECEWKFKQKRYLLRHIKLHHPVKKENK